MAEASANEAHLLVSQDKNKREYGPDSVQRAEGLTATHAGMLVPER